MSHNQQNPAAAQGWIQSKDPKTGRTFYANQITRQTQWEPPPDWVDVPTAAARSSSSLSSQSNPSQPQEDEEPLPSNWQVLHDPTTGKPFYVDHERKITTWTRPSTAKSQTSQPASSTRHLATYNSNNNSSTTAGTRTTTAPAQASYVPAPQAQHHQPQFDYYYSSSSTPSSSAAYLTDFSDALPTLEFQVESIPDAAREHCASCAAPFRATKRRHHCRLCGDLFCDACSPHRAQLPLEGPQYAKPVRLCHACQDDVSEGQYFSYRRYLTPLLLAQSSNTTTNPNSPDYYADQVNASLSALTEDLQQQLQNPSQPPKLLEQLIPVLVPHLGRFETTGARAAVALAAVCALESVFQQTQWRVLTLQTTNTDHFLEWLERNASDRKTLYVQEQVARTLCQLTEPAVVKAWTEQQQQQSPPPEQQPQDNNMMFPLDMGRAMRALLDHLSSTQNPALARWAAATVCHLIQLDQSQTAQAINEVAVHIASGQGPPETVSYTSVVPELIASGGILLLASAMSSEDADTRAHALAALGSVLQSTRALDHSQASLYELSGGLAGTRQDESKHDAALIRSMVAGGAVTGSAVAQVLLSADHSVATLGCQFLASLLLPLLTHPQASGLPLEYDPHQDTSSSLGASRQAALELITAGHTLPALMSLTNSNRPIALRQLAMEVLASLCFGVGELGRVWSHGQYEQGLEHAPAGIAQALSVLEQEGLLTLAVRIVQESSSSGGGGLGFSSAQETPYMRIREAAGIILGSLTACSAQAILSLSSTNSSQWTADPTPSQLRGDGSPKGLGLLECTANCLLFSWQHSDTTSDLLDKLLQAIDAGMVTTLSQVLATPLDWDSPLAVGGIKARTAALKLLGCLAGIALEHALGMQRLMQTIERDAKQSYEKKANQVSNLIEACLSCLQGASILARKALLGQVQLQEHHQAAVLDVVDAALLAVGSLCGSSVPPVSTEGTFVSGDSHMKPRQDAYVSRRQEIAKVACDVVVRQGRNSPALLPTMLVGGLGTAAASSSLRLALAICANGTTEQHSKLGQSGILVPISDSLQTALSKGDLYQFSAALALVRFCGPHAEQGSDAVKQAIRVATNVMNLPANVNASAQEAQQQATLKAECVSALESLSKNASLWSSISQDALPAVTMSLNNSSDPETQKAALRAVLQIVQVPSHAVAAAEAGLALALGKLLRGSSDDDIPMLALEVLHAIGKNEDALRVAQYLEKGVVASICAAIGASATETPKKPSDSRADVAFLGLEILVGVVKSIQTNEDVYTSPKAIALVDAIAGEPAFVRSLCATLLIKTDMKIPQHSDSNLSLQVPKSYGPPLILVPEECAGHTNTHMAAASILYQVSVLASIIESQRSDAFWRVVLEPPADNDKHASVTLCAHFLSLLTLATDYPPFQQVDSLTKPLVLHALFEAFQGLEWDTYLTSVLVAFNVPLILLSQWSDSALQELSYTILKQIMDDPEDVLHLFVQPDTLSKLFDVLAAEQTPHLKQFLASILAQLAEADLLTSAVSGMRTKAIAALASASLSEEEVSPDEDEDVTSARLSSVLMQCLVELCSNDDEIQLSSQEATRLANELGHKICRMVISRFLERARLEQYDMDHGEDILEAPDVQLLVSMAQHKEALASLRKNGGLHALSLVASEGNPNALNALRQASQADPSVLLEGDTHAALLQLVATHDDVVALNLLAQLCKSPKGLGAVASQAKCPAAVERAVEIVQSMVEDASEDATPTPALEDEDEEDDADGDNEEDKEDEDEKEALGIDVPETPSPSKTLRDLAKEETELAIASCAFLAAVAPKGLLKASNSTLMPALAVMVQSEALQFASLQLLSAISPYVEDASGLADVLLTILKPKVVANPVVAAAAQGLSLMFDKISPDQQTAAMQCGSFHFGKVVKSSLVQKEDAAEAAYQLSMLFVLGRGSCPQAFTSAIQTSMMHLVQFRHDPKTAVTQTRFWDAAVSNSLLLLSSLAVSSQSIAPTPLMLARPGKAPRKAITAKAVLAKLSESNGPLALHSQTVLDKLFH